MAAEPDAARMKSAQLKHWDAVAGGWATWLEWTERNFKPLTAWFADAADWVPGARVADVACGPGYPALAAATRVRPGGSVLASDLSATMTAAAAGTAKTRGIDNIEFRTMDAEALELEGQSLDAVTNAYGLMFCPDPLRALREAHRVLKSGGRVAFATWDHPATSPFFNVITPVATRYLSLAPPDPAAPGPFRLSSPGELEAMLRAAAFVNVRVERQSMRFEFESVEQYCQIFADVAWKARIASLTEEQLAAFRGDVARAARPYLDDGGRVRLLATSLCASGARRF